ncbi:hypothetical protein HYR54_00470 [Candidatus Acetothermia bacterium]|nr:hypothetical protein [Candidatus Acetothermia bacterium]
MRKHVAYIAGLLCICLFSRILYASQASSSGQSPLKWYNNWEALGAFVLLAVFAVIVGVVASRANKKRTDYSGSIGFAALGGVIGMATGLSQTPVVSTLMPAILTFLGGIAGYFFTARMGKKGDQKDEKEVPEGTLSKGEKEGLQAAVGTFLMGFSLLLMVGIYLGASLRMSEAPNGNSVLTAMTEQLKKDFSELKNTIASSTVNQNFAEIEKRLGQISEALANPKESTCGGVLCLEGATKMIWAEIEITKDVQILKISGSDKTLFEGKAQKGSKLTQFKDFIEVEWSQQAGKDGVTLTWREAKWDDQKNLLQLAKGQCKVEEKDIKPYNNNLYRVVLSTSTPSNNCSFTTEGTK